MMSDYKECFKLGTKIIFLNFSDFNLIFLLKIRIPFYLYRNEVGIYIKYIKA